MEQLDKQLRIYFKEGETMASKKNIWKKGKDFYKSKTGRLIDAAMWAPLLYEGAKWSWGGKEGGRAGFKHGSPNPKRPKGGWKP